MDDANRSDATSRGGDYEATIDPFFEFLPDTGWNACVGKQGYEENYVDGHMEAAQRLVALVMDEQLAGSRDTLVLPILYNARHGIELALKFVINRLHEIGMVATRHAVNHDIRSHWRHLVDSRVGDEAVRNLVSELGSYVVSLAAIDDDGQQLRYAEDQEGRRSLDDLAVVNLQLIRHSLDAVGSILASLFVAHRDMSIFRGLSAVMPTGGEIVIGGDEDGSIPIQEFERLLTKFPTTTELNRYARARVADVVGQYVDGMADARRHYEEYMNRHKAIGATGSLDTEELLEAELAKYQLIRDTLRGWLAAAEVRVERDWQQLLMKFLLLIFPKYVAILENVQIADVYSTPGRARRRFIDIALVDAAGNLDVIEIKRPRGGLLAGGDYRENGFPSRELSGTIMQAEKYLFHLSKWGLDGERALTERYAAKLPPGMSIRVTNPKAIVILGRDPTGGVGGEQAVDLEVVRRKYANVMDIMSYDDLLRRLDNVIASLRSRIDEETYI